MRLSTLLAQYLYQQKRLDLPGLGSFYLEQTAGDDPESSRHSKNIDTGQIRFVANTSLKESPDLVNFISSHSGKIRALASADLESHLEIAHQFLNIGKPFTLEGIGNIVKTQSGEFVFTPGQAVSEIKKEPAREHFTAPADEVSEDYNYKSIFYPKKIKATWKKPVAVFLLVAGLALAIWGGYEVYKRTSAKTETKEGEEVTGETIAAVDTSNTVKDTLVPPPVNTSLPPGNFKFVLETTNAQRAIPRFKTLKEYQWAVQLETRDSVTYKIYMVLPASAGDTARIRDSLTTLTGRKVIIE